MPSPFPGMALYIETPRIWSDFYGDLAGEIRAELNRTIRPTYYAGLTPYVTYETIEVTQRKREGIRPDVEIWKTAAGPLATTTVPLVETKPVESRVALELSLELFRLKHCHAQTAPAQDASPPHQELHPRS